MKKRFNNIKIGLMMIFAAALLCLSLVILLSSCNSKDDKYTNGAPVFAEISSDPSNDSSGNTDEPTESKTVYITIDDGPTRDNSEKILDVLDKYNIKATFFLQGHNITGNSLDFCKRAIETGHIIGCHSYSHDLSEIYSSPEKLVKEIEHFEKTLKKLFGEQAFSSMPKVFRFPGGSSQNGLLEGEQINEYINAVEELGYRIYDWNCLSADGELRKWDRENESEKDYNAYAVEFMKENFLSSLERAERFDEPIILLLHDKWTATDEGLTVDGLQFFEWMLKTLIDKGYSFDTVDKLPSYIN